MGNIGNIAVAFIARFKRFEQNVDKARKSVERFGREVKKTSVVANAGFKRITQGAKIAGMAVATHLNPFTMQGRQFLLGMGKALTWAGTRLTSFGHKLVAVGQRGLWFVSMPILVFLGSLVKATAEWDMSLVQMSKTIDMSSDAIEALGGRFTDLSEQIGVSRHEMARTAALAGQLGIQGSDNLFRFTSTMQALGVTTDLSSEQAAVAMARFMNIMGTAREDVRRLGSVVVEMGNNFAAFEGEILEMARRLAGAGKVVNAVEDQIIGLATALTEVGVRPQLGATAMTKVIKGIDKAVDGVTDNMEQFLAVTELTRQQFILMWKDNPVKVILQIVTGLKRMSENGQSAWQAMEEMGFQNERTQQSLAKLMGNVEGFSRALDMASEEMKRNTALTKEAEKFYGSLKQQLKAIWSTLANTFGQLGDSFGDVIQQWVESSKRFIGVHGDKLIDWVESLDKQTRKLILTASLATAALFPLAAVLGTVALGAALPFKFLGAAMTGTVGIMAKFIKLSKSWKGIRVFRAVKAGKAGMLGLSESQLGRYTKAVSVFTKMTSVLGAIASTAIGALSALSFLGVGFKDIANIAFGAFSIVKDAIGGAVIVLNGMREGLSAMLEPLRGIGGLMAGLIGLISDTSLSGITKDVAALALVWKTLGFEIAAVIATWRTFYRLGKKTADVFGLNEIAELLFKTAKPGGFFGAASMKDTVSPILKTSKTVTGLNNKYSKLAITTERRKQLLKEELELTQRMMHTGLNEQEERRIRVVRGLIDLADKQKNTYKEQLNILKEQEAVQRRLKEVQRTAENQRQVSAWNSIANKIKETQGENRKIVDQYNKSHNLLGQLNQRWQQARSFVGGIVDKFETGSLAYQEMVRLGGIYLSGLKQQLTVLAQQAKLEKVKPILDRLKLRNKLYKLQEKFGSAFADYYEGVRNVVQQFKELTTVMGGEFADRQRHVFQQRIDQLYEIYRASRKAREGVDNLLAPGTRVGSVEAYNFRIKAAMRRSLRAQTPDIGTEAQMNLEGNVGFNTHLKGMINEERKQSTSLKNIDEGIDRLRNSFEDGFQVITLSEA